MPYSPADIYNSVYSAVQEALRVLTSDKPEKIRIDYSGGSVAIYVGFAAPGTAEDETEWKVMKLTYNPDDNMTQLDWASGNADYDKKWTDRATYVYS
jgi:hypothetical protein